MDQTACWESPVHSVELLQPGSVLLQPAQTLSISCRVSGYSLTDSSYGTAWIRQPAGKGLEWIGHKDTSSSYYKESLKSKFSIDLDTSSKTVTLTGKNMQPGDSAVYYCARAPQSLREYEELNKNN
uniref:Ig-like domain-containing protein n=1 Tax=Neogobius melanostomus TaxID=47308 RepID=A0A8C6WYQ7_9GOBI